MSKIIVEFDEEELKHIIAGILSEKILRILPHSTKFDMAKAIKRDVHERLVEKMSEEVESV